MKENHKYDALDGWREEVGIKTTKGEVKHYAGGCEYDPTAEAIMAYMREEEAKKALVYEKIAKQEEEDIAPISKGIKNFAPKQKDEGMER